MSRQFRQTVMQVLKPRYVRLFELVKQLQHPVALHILASCRISKSVISRQQEPFALFREGKGKTVRH
jgi:hypothetical protein